MKSAFLPGLPIDLIIAAYAAAPGNEIESGKFLNPESSAALAANAFGFFLNRPADFPPLPKTTSLSWPAVTIELEASVRFPWSGGRHPCLDVLLKTENALIGIESKRYEPFRSKSETSLSEAYWRDVWGNSMTGYARVRDHLRDGDKALSHLDAGQLIKHAFALRTAVHRSSDLGKTPVLFYVYAEPDRWPHGSIVPPANIRRHRDEIKWFAECVEGNEVVFRACNYRELLADWETSNDVAIRSHAAAIAAHFSI